MIKRIVFGLGLYASLYAYEENIFDISFLQGKEFDIQLYSSSKSNTSYGYVQTKQKQHSFWGSARKNEYFIDIIDFGTCALKDMKNNKIDALCKIENKKEEYTFEKKPSEFKIYKLSLKDQKQLSEDNKTIDFDYSADLLKYSSKNKNLEKIIDDFNENLNEVSLAQMAKENREKWKKEEIVVSDFLSQSYVFYQDDKIISLGKNIYEYKGGAHGMMDYQRKTYDIINMTLINLKMELKLENEDFKKLIKEKLSSLYNENELFDLKDFKMTEIFEVRKDGLVFIWEPYEIAPYSTGAVEIFIDFKELNPFWKKNSKLSYLSLAK
ncbi:DUF3298 and DUF4163 domain-containing protein [Campylobacter armoricus]|uniref:DUF3298 and DUF 4163 domain-containing protein n=1 Tax=Campylobacter armoricus TaxID=2505970 RepID=A0A7L5I0S4_9BACT|nr:DUF3298 and DUF4163 domain-containing protein [Campylobacter armoricus]QKF79711.1 DUF3298 and DUF 4163 domain-containing protein [Campylobacter armoricus]